MLEIVLKLILHAKNSRFPDIQKLWLKVLNCVLVEDHEPHPKSIDAIMSSGIYNDIVRCLQDFNHSEIQMEAIPVFNNLTLGDTG